MVYHTQITIVNGVFFKEPLPTQYVVPNGSILVFFKEPVEPNRWNQHFWIRRSWNEARTVNRKRPRGIAWAFLMYGLCLLGDIHNMVYPIFPAPFWRPSSVRGACSRICYPYHTYHRPISDLGTPTWFLTTNPRSFIGWTLVLVFTLQNFVGRGVATINL